MEGQRIGTGQTNKYRYNMVLCLYSYAAGHTKMGVPGTSIPDTRKSSNNLLIVKTVYLAGWLTVGRMDRSMIDGWIYSKPVGWLVCMFA